MEGKNSALRGTAKRADTGEEGQGSIIKLTSLMRSPLDAAAVSPRRREEKDNDAYYGTRGVMLREGDKGSSILRALTYLSWNRNPGVAVCRQLPDGRSLGTNNGGVPQPGQGKLAYNVIYLASC